MKNLSDSNVHKKIQYFFVIGTVFVVIALITWLIPSVYIESIDGRIDSLTRKGIPSGPEAQMLIDLEWSKIWWIMTQTTVFNPTATIMSAIGIILISIGLIVRFVYVKPTLQRQNRHYARVRNL